MALFVEVQSVEKNCPVIINLDHIVEIAPLTSGGCMLYLSEDSGFSNMRPSVEVKDNYNQFKQFAMQTVTAEDIQKRIAAIKPKDTKTVDEEVEIPVLGKKK